jgi:ATP-dependent helicase HrpA
LLLYVDLQLLEQFPRYLRAAQSRLQRAVNDPRKDASKAEPFAPIWQAFLAKRSAAREQGIARRLHFAFEELRVSLFAPELKPAPSVTIASVAAAVHALR